MAKILLADNDPGFLKERKRLIEDAGYQVIGADNPDAAWRVMQEQRPDLALLDVCLIDDKDDKDASGVELAEKIYAGFPMIPFILMSERVDVSRVQKLWRASAKGRLFFVGKSNAENMIQMLRQVLQNTRTVEERKRARRQRKWMMGASLALLTMGVFFGIVTMAVNSWIPFLIALGLIVASAMIYLYVLAFRESQSEPSEA